MRNSRELMYNYEFCEGLRKGSKLIYIPDIKHLYKLKLYSKLSKRYICYNKTCSASAVVDSQNEKLVRIPKSSAAHNHTDNESLRKKMIDISELRKGCGNGRRRVSLKRNCILEALNEVGTSGAINNFPESRESTENCLESSLELKRSPASSAASSPAPPYLFEKQTAGCNEATFENECTKACVNRHDEYDIFGSFVASELRGLRNDVSVIRSVKKKIQLTILEAYEAHTLPTSSKIYKNSPSTSYVFHSAEQTPSETVQIKTEHPEENSESINK